MIGQKLNRHGIRVYTPQGKIQLAHLTPSSIPDTIRKEKTILAQESKNEDRKQRIREAFHDGKQVERMPAREDMAPQHSDDVIYRVAPYCRVSTMSEMQAESFEIQQQYYNEFIAKHPNWTLVRIYADEGISATSVNNRKPLYFSSRYRISVTAAFENSVLIFLREVI